MRTLQRIAAEDLLLDAYWEKSRLCIVQVLMERPNWPLHTRKLTPSAKLALLRRLAWDLAVELCHVHLHCGLLHADLKLDNVLLLSSSAEPHQNGMNGKFRLIDYGNAVAFSDLHSYAKEQWPVQSLPYRAPEVLERTQDPLTAAMDWWSFGVLLVEVALQKHPFAQATSDESLAAAHFDLLGPKGSSSSSSVSPSSLNGASECILEGSEDICALRLFNLAHLTGLHDEHWLDFVERLLRLDPQERLGGVQVLVHPFLAPCSPILAFLPHQ